MNATATLFDAGETLARPRREVARVKVTVTEEDVTGVAGAALWGPMLDRLNLVDVADRRALRRIGPGGYTGGECYRTLVEVLLAGGEFLSDRSLLEGATEALRGQHAFPSHTTLFRFCAGADFGQAQKAAAANRTMLARAWAMGAGPTGGVVTIDPDATLVDTYGPGKEGSTFTYRGEVGLSPLIGVCGETGDVLALRARGGNAHPGRANAGFIRECVAAIPAPVRARVNLWVRVDSAGYQHDVFHTCEQLGAVFTVTAPQRSNVRNAVLALAAEPATVWLPALTAEAERGSEIAETTIEIGNTTKNRRLLRLIVRRQRTRAGDQLSLDDLDGWRFHAIVTNLPALFAPAAEVEAHHRLRGGIAATYAGGSTHLELGWAVTGYGSQGVTVDRGICVVEPASTRAGIYVGLTRGRTANDAFVIDAAGVTDPEDALAAAIARPPNAVTALAARQRLHEACGIDPPELHPEQDRVGRGGLGL